MGEFFIRMFAIVGVLATMLWLVEVMNFLERRSLDRLREKARSIAAAGKAEDGDGDERSRA